MKNVKSFGDFDKKFTLKTNSKIVLLPVCYDKTSTWIKGAGKGPIALLEASPALEFYDIDTDSEVYLNGIYTAPPIKFNGSPELLSKIVEKKILNFIDENKFTVLLGGEHSVSIGAIKAYASRFKDLSILQLDAHSDLRDEYESSKYNHACVMARAKEVAPIVQAGIRSASSEEKNNMDYNNIFFAKDIAGKTGWEKKIIKKLKKNVYVTIDLDVFDPSIMKATGTPEPGGLLWYEVINLLKAVSKNRNIVGFDVVELCPPAGSKSDIFTAAKLVYTFLSYIFIKGAK
ncbi:agmatinase [Candidatus Omnitrophus magneticus]|uniref:Agmatinase n=1 Tax=Candidatus Omnitrophus magneticus TaxID=1609969 RepID=A0A0F0CUJ3_9BACT|nr:agmatinase [Candidatus Omnitrophus magneticus]